jgi:nucleoside-diphosphate-sugar epimerase
VARVLIVGCGCRGRELAVALHGRGHAVRGTSRHPARRGAIEAVGAEAAAADPDRLGTLTPHLHGISVVCWLLGSATGEPEAVAALHAARLESLLEALVDTPVRGLVYEGAGTVGRADLERGAQAVRRAASTHRMAVEIVTHDPRDEDWAAAAAAAVDRVLAR